MKRRLISLLLFLLILLAFGVSAGPLLVKDNAQKSDVIVVLNGGIGDARYRKGLELLRSGYGNSMFWDARTDEKIYGHTPADLAAEYEQQSANELADRVKVCPTMENGTKFEVKYVVQCVQEMGAKKVLIVTSDYHSRRALSIFRQKAPQIEWTISAMNDPREFGIRWWQQREWAKTLVYEWERVVWWNLVDRWRG